jgi:hypothetical protein
VPSNRESAADAIWNRRYSAPRFGPRRDGVSSIRTDSDFRQVVTCDRASIDAVTVDTRDA